MFASVCAFELIDEYGRLDPAAKPFLQLFRSIGARDLDRSECWQLVGAANASPELEIMYGNCEGTTQDMVELALLKAGVEMHPNPFYDADVEKERIAEGQRNKKETRKIHLLELRNAKRKQKAKSKKSKAA